MPVSYGFGNQINTWDYWTATTNSTITVSAQVWDLWNVTTAATNVYEQWVTYDVGSRRYQPVITPPLNGGWLTPRWTPEEVAEERRVRAAAESRAMALLLETLTPEQRADYEEHKHFRVRGRSGRRYVIRCGRAHNVYQVNKQGLAIANLCGHVDERVPDQDNILAQKFMLEHDDEEFRRVANITAYPQPREIPGLAVRAL